jgi:Flp pilus assembly protein TadG
MFHIVSGLNRAGYYIFKVIMKIQKSIRGQTLIETALILFLLMLIVLGLTEFARAWYTKNSLKNASRHGARLAVVTSGITCYGPQDCNGGTCPTTKPTTEVEIKDCVCASPGIKNDSRTSVQIEDEGDCNFQQGDEIKVTVSFNDPDFFIVGGPPWPWPDELNTSSESTMRYE